MVEIKNLSKSYRLGKYVLNNITYHFESKKITGIVANNGEGKTTLFNCIYGLDSAYTGHIQFDFPVGKDQKSRCGYLPTDLYFYPKITGREYVIFCATARQKSHDRIDEWAELLDLPLDDYVSNYSTGMKKKVGLLGLIIQDNDVIILDEPFNGLDIASNILLNTILLKLKSQGKTVLLSSHILSTLTDISDYIVVLKGGQFNAIYEKCNFSALKIDMDADNNRAEKLIEKLM
ncbi:ATP-binding cassette domain-containing protein [Pedobacter sp.]|uniref:ABC transporter ATP-binding protein n=1 Tax=Pedobacter sp. TaxID=1411316 RepID=UPI003BA9F40F